MLDEKSLTTVEQKQVEFYGDKIIAVQTKNGRIYIPVRPICESLGLAWSSQLQRIRRDPVLNDEIVSVFVTNTESQRGGRDVQCLPLDMLHGFLFGINATRVRKELRNRVLRYQRECYRVLHEAFQEGQLSTDSDFDELLQTADAEVVDAYKMALAIVKLAKHQIVLDGRIKYTEEQLGSHAERLDQIEATLTDDGRVITETQASHLSQAVKAVAMAMPKPNFQQVYGQMYRHYEITSYKLLPAAKFDDAMKFLTAWFVRLTGNDDVPF